MDGKCNYENKIWDTRVARINSSKRLKSNDFWSQILLIYYSLFIIYISIINFNSPKKEYDILTLIFSILVIVISVFIYAMNYKERSVMFHNVHIKLQTIYDKYMDLKDDEDKRKEIIKEYHTILELSENHSYYDYLKGKCDSYKLKYDEYNKYVFYKLTRIFTKLIFFTLPIVICFYISEFYVYFIK